MAGDPRVELRGWRMEQAPRAGATLDLALTWRAIARLDRDWVVFAHLVDAGGTIVAEDNRQPQAGVFPTAQWAAGDWVESHHLIALPATLAPGAYTLRVGMFDPQSGDRAGVYSKRGKLLGDYLTLGKVTVEARG